MTAGLLVPDIPSPPSTTRLAAINGSAISLRWWNKNPVPKSLIYAIEVIG